MPILRHDKSVTDIRDRAIFYTAPENSAKDILFKNGLMWLKNDHLALLV